MRAFCEKVLKQWPFILLLLAVLLLILWPNIIFQDNQFPILKQKEQEIVSIELVKTPVEQKNILLFGGDIMLSRTVNAKMERYKNYNWPLEKIANLFSEADLAIANLESPFVLADNYHVPSGSFSFKANPLSVSSLVLAGFDVLSLANNHALNQGSKGINNTKSILDEAGISYVGLSENNLVIKESNGIRFSFLAYTYNNDSSLIANMDDLEKLHLDIAAAKSQSDVVIVIMHAGIEYVREPNRQQKNFAYAAIDSGADLVVGHHPHWPQIIEDYQGKKIIYSLGNLVFDQMWSKETSQGLLAKIFFDGKELKNIEYIPIIIRDYGQAEIMPEGADKTELLESLNLLNNSF